MENNKELFLIANSETSKDLPFDEKEYLAPYPTQTSKTYVWNKGLKGSAGFYYETAKIISESCTPKGILISMGSISKKVIKE